MSNKKQVLLLKISGSLASAIIIDDTGQELARGSHKFQAHRPQAHYLEYDPLEIIYSLRSAIHEVSQSLFADIQNLEGVGLVCPSQMALIWDRDSGQAHSPVVAAECLRADRDSHILANTAIAADIESRSGLPICPSYPALKWKSLMKGGYTPTSSSCFSTLDSWIIYHLSGRVECTTDVSQASQTLLFSPQTLSWDPFLLQEFSIPESQLPSIQSKEILGQTQGFIPLPDKLPILSSISTEMAHLVGNRQLGMGKASMYTEQHRSKILIYESSLQRTAPSSANTLYRHQSQTHRASIHYGWSMPGTPSSIESAESSLFQELREGPYVIPILPEQLHVGTPNTIRYHMMNISAENENLISLARQAATANYTNSLLQKIAARRGQGLKSLSIHGDWAESAAHCQFLADLLQISISKNQNKYPEESGLLYLCASISNFLSPASLSKLHALEHTFLPSVDPITAYAFQESWAHFQKQSIIPQTPLDGNTVDVDLSTPLQPQNDTEFAHSLI